MNYEITPQNAKRLSHNLSSILSAMKTAFPHLSDDGTTKDVALKMIEECHERLSVEISALRRLYAINGNSSEEQVEDTCGN